MIRPLALARRPRLAPLVPVLLSVVAAVAVGCDAGTVSATPSIAPGSSDAPREVNLIAKDYSFLPDALDLVPGETVLLHVINGGLEVHEAVIGDMATQEAWEIAEAATVGAPPGPTPLVSVPPDVAGLRIIVRSGERVDVRWAVPVVDVPFIVGCHIPGHWQKGMQIPVSWVSQRPSSGAPASSPATAPATTPATTPASPDVVASPRSAGLQWYALIPREGASQRTTQGAPHRL